MLVELNARERAELKSFLGRDLPGSIAELEWRARDRKFARRVSKLQREWAEHKRRRPVPAS